MSVSEAGVSGGEMRGWDSVLGVLGSHGGAGLGAGRGRVWKEPLWGRVGRLGGREAGEEAGARAQWGG